MFSSNILFQARIVVKSVDTLSNPDGTTTITFDWDEKTNAWGNLQNANHIEVGDTIFYSNAFISVNPKMQSFIIKEILSQSSTTVQCKIENRDSTDPVNAIYAAINQYCVISRPTSNLSLFPNVAADGQLIPDFFSEHVSNFNLRILDEKISSIIGLDSNGDYVPKGSSASTTISSDMEEIFSFLSGGLGASVSVSDSAPTDPSPGDLWWNSDEGVLKIYYSDSDSSQWVDASPSGSSSSSGGSSGPSSLITDGTSTVSFDSANEVVMNTDLNVNAINLSGHIIPTQNAQFDLGSAEYKIRHLYLSNNSLWLGDDVKVGIDENGIPEFKKVKRASGHVPRVILLKAIEAGLGSSVEEVAAHALGWFNAEVGIGATPNLEPDAVDLSDDRITLKLWYSYAITNIPGFEDNFPDISSIFPPKDGGGDLYDDGDYEEITKIGKSNKHVPLTEVNTRTDSFMLTSSDHGTYIRIISGGDVVVSLPDDVTEDIPIGTTVIIGRNGDGNVIFAPVGGSDIQTPYSLQIALKFGKVTAMKTAPNTWEIEGNLS